jgi:hypothetical protein
MARFCTEEYEIPSKENLKNVFMHLTNYSLNKKNWDYDFNQDGDFHSGSKRTLSSI